MGDFFTFTYHGLIHGPCVISLSLSPSVHEQILRRFPFVCCRFLRRLIFALSYNTLFVCTVWISRSQKKILERNIKSREK